MVLIEFLNIKSNMEDCWRS